ncbi:MAG: hypothetical protein K9J13_00715 [Saprospiraceae bacterium]|nr:hypothetical protein [Saprospiraceae bacterium]
MKTKRINLLVILGLMSLITMMSCSKDDDKSTEKNKIQTQIQNIIQSGTWRIAYFNDSGSDETSNFTGFNFTFGDNNALTAIKNTTTYNGIWNITDSNSNDDTKDDLHFNINFNLTNEFEDLNDDWEIKSYSENMIELIDVSGGNGGTDYLTFEKN